MWKTEKSISGIRELCGWNGVVVSKEDIRRGFPEKQYLSKNRKEVMELEGRNLREEHS